jgi:zinc protease
VAAATLQDCAKAFCGAWSGSPPNVLITTSTSFLVPPKVVGAVLNESRKVPVHLPPALKAEDFAYKNFGTPGRFVDDQFLPDLDVHLARFKNGVRFNFKSTQFEADMVYIFVRIGGGRISIPENQPGLDWLAAYGLINGGLRRHSIAQLDSLMSRHVLSVHFGTESDACLFSVRCARRELPLALQIVAGYITDPAYRLDALPGAQASIGMLYGSFEATSGGGIAFQAERFMSGGNTRVGSPEVRETNARNFGELERWLEPQFKHGAIELCIVGDVGWDDASKAVASTLGALPKRDALPKPGKGPRVTFVTPSQFPHFIQLTPGLKQSAIAWYWPVTDLKNVYRERRFRLLSVVLSNLIYSRIREELGATYSPAADFVQYDGLPTFSYLVFHADVDPVQAPRVAQIIRREIQNLINHGIDEDQFQRAKKPFLRNRDDDLRTNSYWSYTVLRDAQQRPARIEAARDRTADTASITRAEVEKLARRYLDPEKGFLFIAEPGPIDKWGSKYMWDAK